MKTITRLPRLTTWSACSQLAELALVIDALPSDYRVELVEAALQIDGLHDCESYLAGELRSLAFDSVTQLYGPSLSQSWFGDRRDAALGLLPTSLRDGADPAAVQLAVCDLIEDIAARMTCGAKEQGHES